MSVERTNKRRLELILEKAPIKYPLLLLLLLLLIKSGKNCSTPLRLYDEDGKDDVDDDDDDYATLI